MFLKQYNCASMIPYPSGKLHIGHSRNYIINDVYNRFLWNLGIKSKMSMSWDSFGTPAENASIRNFLQPIKYINSNTFFMKKQLRFNSLSLFWKKFFSTHFQNYYFFNHLYFLKLIKIKAIYLSNKKVNWDPCENSVLSEEQVIKNRGWRSSCLIKKINIFTYYLNLKKYKKEIYNEINNLDWPENVKIMQKNWIFSKNFIFFIFFYNNFKKIKFYFFIKNKFLFLFKLFNYYFLLFKIKKIKFINNGFWFKNNLNFKLEIFQIKLILKNLNFNYKKNFHSYFKFKKKIILIKNFKWLYLKNLYIYYKLRNNVKINKKWRVRDWGISRQRYWGCPLPFKYCNFCKKLTCFKKNDIPLILNKNLKSNKNYYNKIINFNVCNYCGKKNYLEINTMDTFIDSSWYYYKYFYKNNLFNFNFPLNLYIGGVEHSILHLFYSRYFSKIFRDIKYTNFGEPIKILNTQGVVLKKKIINKSHYKYEKMSKSKNNVISSEFEIKKFCLNSFRLTSLSYPVNKNIVWDEKIVRYNFFFIKKFYKKINILNFKDTFYKNEFIKLENKIYILNLTKNIKNFKNYVKNLKYSTIINKLKALINKNIMIFNSSVFKHILIILIRYINFFIPLFSLIIWNKIETFKFLNINLKINIYKLMINLKIYDEYILIIYSKYIGKIYFKKLKKKKIFNYIFFKKNIFKVKINKILKFKNNINLF